MNTLCCQQISEYSTPYDSIAHVRVRSTSTSLIVLAQYIVLAPTSIYIYVIRSTPVQVDRKTKPRLEIWPYARRLQVVMSRCPEIYDEWQVGFTGPLSGGVDIYQACTCMNVYTLLYREKESRISLCTVRLWLDANSMNLG